MIYLEYNSGQIVYYIFRTTAEQEDLRLWYQFISIVTAKTCPS